MKNGLNRDSRNTPGFSFRDFTSVICITMILGLGSATSIADTGNDGNTKQTGSTQNTTKKGVKFTDNTIDNEHRATKSSTTRTVNGVKQDNLSKKDIKALREKHQAAGERRKENFDKSLKHDEALEAQKNATKKTSKPTASTSQSAQTGTSTKKPDYKKFKQDTAKHPGTAESLNKGKQAQTNRVNRKIEKMDRKTQKTLKGQTDESQAARDKGNAAKQKRDMAKMKQELKKQAPGTKTSTETVKQNTARNTKAPARAANPDQKWKEWNQKNPSGKGKTGKPSSHKVTIKEPVKTAAPRRVLQPGSSANSSIINNANKPGTSGYDKFKQDFARKPGATDTLNRGKQAQTDRVNRKINNMDSRTQKTLKGQTAESQTLRERGQQAQHKRQHAKRMEHFRKNTPKGTKPSSAAIKKAPGTKPATPRAKLGAPKPGAGKMAKAGKVAGKGLVVGLAVDVVTCGEAPGAVDAGKWTVDTMRNPDQAGKRTGELAKGAGKLAVKSAQNLTSPKKLGKCAVNTVKGVGQAVQGVGEYTVSRVKDPRMLGKDAVSVVKTTGKVGYAVGDGVYQTGKYVGTGVAKGAVATGKGIGKGATAAGRWTGHAAKDTGKWVNKAGKNTGKWTNKAAKDTGKWTKKAAKDSGKWTKKASRKTGKAAKKAGCAVVGLIKKPKGC